MKKAAAVLTLIWGLLIIQPAFALFGGKPAYSISFGTKEPGRAACSPKKEKPPACTKKTCNSSSEPEEKKNCKKNGCNPTLGCSSGNFYVHDHFAVQLHSPYIAKQQLALIDDNRISKNLSECWHPPEQLS